MCIGFNLKGILNHFVTLLSTRVLNTLKSSRSIPSSSVSEAGNEVYKARITNLTNLLNLPFDSLIASSVKDAEYNLNLNLNSDGSTFSSPRTNNVKMNWRETHRLKGEVMLRILFHVASQCVHCLSGEAWMILTELLVRKENEDDYEN